MPITPIQVNVQPRKLSTLEKIAMGLGLADKALELGLAYPRYRREVRAEKRAQDEVFWNKVMRENEMRTNQEKLDLEKKKASFEQRRVNLDLSEVERRQTPLTADQQAEFMRVNQQYGFTRPPSTVGQLEALEPELAKIKMAYKFKADEDARALRNEKTKDQEARYIPDLRQYATGAPEAEQIKKQIGNLKTAMYNLDNIIDVRERKGVEFFDRNEVKIGKTMASDLQLQLKELFTLGVLSNSDLRMLQRLIPDDPTANDWTPFGDPILVQMKAFRGSLIQKIKNNLESRGLDPTPILQQLAPREPTKEFGLTDNEERRLRELEAKERAETLAAGGAK